VGKLTHLEKLNLRNNQLTSLPEEIGNCTNIKLLFLSWNKLKTLPPSVGKLTNLEILYLDNNQLTSLPKEIGNCTKLSGKGKHGYQRLNFFGSPPSTLKDPPPEICKQGFDAVKAYFEAYWRQRHQRYQRLFGSLLPGAPG
jgi:hypothetical protein